MLEINGKLYPTYEFNEIDRNKYVGFIYVTVNKVNGKKYVGQHTRWNPEYTGSGKAYLSAFLKYGKENFERHIIYLAKTQEELDEMETWYINYGFGLSTVKSDDWYNLNDKARGGNVFAGRKLEDNRRTAKRISKKRLEFFKNNPEERKKISLSVKNLWKNEQYRKNMIQRHADFSGKNNPMFGKGYKLSGEKNGMYGKTHDYSAREKIRKARSIPILVKFKNKNEVMSFSSQQEFAKFMGVSKTTVGRWIKDCSKNRRNIEYIKEVKEEISL